MDSKYDIELWSRTGVFLADISRYVKNFSYSMQRNEAEQLQLSIDLDAYEAYCASIGTNPTSILGPYQTDIKVKRNGEYLFGTHVGQISVEMGETYSTISVRAFGYLNLLIDRYVTKTYPQADNWDATQIAWDLIATTQAQTNGSLGMTQGTTTSVYNRERTYVRQNVKDAIVNLTKLVNGNFDFEFTHDRQFNVYQSIGSDKSVDLQFIYPGNIRKIVVPRDGLSLYNKIYGIGSGFGDEALTSTQGDNDSQLNYGVHEKISLWNSVIIQDTLDQNTAGDLDLRKGLLEIPQMMVSGEDFDLNDIGIGDKVTARIEEHPFLATVTGVYRVERIDVDVDENDAEDISISFDNHGLNQSEYESEQ